MTAIPSWLPKKNKAKCFRYKTPRTEMSPLTGKGYSNWGLVCKNLYMMGPEGVNSRDLFEKGFFDLGSTDNLAAAILQCKKRGLLTTIRKEHIPQRGNIISPRATVVVSVYKLTALGEAWASNRMRFIEIKKNNVYGITNSSGFWGDKLAATWISPLPLPSEIKEAPGAKLDSFRQAVRELLASDAGADLYSLDGIQEVSKRATILREEIQALLGELNNRVRQPSLLQAA